MRRSRQRFVWLGISIFGMLTLVTALMGQVLPEAATGVPATSDWSSHHIIFSQPATAEQAERVQRDPRYWQQLYRQSEVRVLQAETLGLPGSDGQFDSNAELLDGNQKLTGDWAEDMGSGASVGAANYPAKFSFSLTVANCASASHPDFVVYGTGLLGSGAQASIAAYDNIYSGCIGTVPTIYWAYNTGGTVVTSPVFSGDGTQVAFVQSNGSGIGVVVLLKWAASTTETITNPTSPTVVVPASYPGCTAPCMTTFVTRTAGGTPNNDTGSSVFYDYLNDIGYVGDNAGWLHKFTPVFKATPAEVKTGGWPVQVSTTALTSPVHDSVSGNVFVNDGGGFLYRVDSSSAAVTASGHLDFSSSLDAGPGIVQGPIVDSTTGTAFVFAPSDGTANCTGGAACTAVYKLSTSFASGNAGTKVTLGPSTVTGTAPNPLYIGAFDSTYQSSVNGTGNLYVCGDVGANPTLYRVPITAGVFGTVASVAALTPAGKNPTCSPVTDIANPNATGGAAESLFFSVQNNGHPTACASKGCVLSFVDMPWQASTAFTVGQEILVLRTANNTLYVNVATIAGTSGASPPTWPAAVGTITGDGTVSWVNQGPSTVTPLGFWAKTHAYAVHARIVDSNGNVEIVTVAGTSGGATPGWGTTAGAITHDGSVTWINGGVLANAALPAAGGTSGIVFDNTVGAGTLAGASQVYFSTLSNQACGTSGTGGCAMQASQSALK